MNIIVKGEYLKENNRYIFTNDRVLTLNKCNKVEISDDKRVSITTDISAFDKLYYVSDNGTIAISDKLRDFYDRPIDENLLAFQLYTGFVPYPFTILKGVRKALPGITMDFKKDGNNKWRCEYNVTELKSFFDAKYDKGGFKRGFLHYINKLKSLCGEKIIISFSGGFDSFLLANLFKENIRGVCQYRDLPGEAGLEEKFKNCIKNVPWYVYNQDDIVDTAVMNAYFESLDEPSSDPAGLAEFLMCNKLRQCAMINDAIILDGLGADTIFANGRNCFKEFLLGKALLGSRRGLGMIKKIPAESAIEKSLDYFKSTKTRYYDTFAESAIPDSAYKKEISFVFDLYSNALKKIERVNFFAFLNHTLYRNSRSINRIKPVTDHFKFKFIFPFCHHEIAKMAFSIPGRYKVGYKTGKKILRNSFREFDFSCVRSGSFLPGGLWHRITGSRLLPDYHKFCLEKWKTNNYSKNRKET
ncbi:MAG: hypothetical protein JW994_05990 [Candidatus Omnitrophica bacterium]|nr:hypothetical protein [Candidatus Omnitrophota bacterium]